jgi:hypothetical protein
LQNSQHYAMFGAKLPKELAKQLEILKKNLG